MIDCDEALPSPLPASRGEGKGEGPAAQRPLIARPLTPALSPFHGEREGNPPLARINASISFAPSPVFMFAITNGRSLR